MANITSSQFGRFGIKEVADVAFYPEGAINVSETNGVTIRTGFRPVLKFDTLKISNLEFTGETAEARGGKGNAVLMSWDHSREATLTLEDALMSMDTLNAMLSSQSLTGTAGSREILTINANGFPGVYTVVGKTYARDEHGNDHFLTFVIWRAKVQSEASFEMSADGDPSTLNLTLKVLRATTNTDTGALDGDMIKFIIDNMTGTNHQVVLPGYDTSATATTYTVTFITTAGERKEYELSSDASLYDAAEAAETGKTWTPAIASGDKPTGNITYRAST